MHASSHALDCLLGQVVPLRAGETINWTFTDRPALDDADSKA